MGKTRNERKAQKQKAVESGPAHRMEKIAGWILAAAIVIIPLLIRVHVGLFIAPKITFEILNTGVQTDLFEFYKWAALLATAIILVVVFVIRTWLQPSTIKPGYINIPVLLITVLAAVSLAASQYKSIALFGFYDLREGTITLLLYLAFMFVAVNTEFDQALKKAVFWGLGVVTFVNAVMGILYFIGVELIKIPLIEWLVVPEGVQGQWEGVLTATLSNPNYVSGFAGAIAMAFFVMAILTEDRKWRMWSALFSILGFVLCVTALSTSGFMVLYILVPAAIIFALFIGNPRQVLGTAVIIICFWAVMLIGMGIYQPRVWQEADVLGILRQGADVSAASVDSATNQDDEWPGKEFGLPKPGLAPGSGRLYIWQETARLILKKPVFGYGADTLGYYFPHWKKDRATGLMNYTTFTTKPHCFYLAFAFNYGIPALLALLTLFFLHFVKTVKFIITHKNHEMTPIVAALFAFWLGFLIQWVVNDSVIGTSVVFWILFGMAVSLMREAEEAEAKPAVTRGRA